MDEKMTPRGMDRADTGQWRLVIYITRDSLEAWLQPLADRSATRRIASASWERAEDGADLLHKIENAVYDHPQLLEDYSADIIIETARTLWVPDSIINNEDRSEEVFTDIYGCEPDDMMSDRLGDKGVLWWMVPGLPAFLSRTFPGARVLSHQCALVSYLDRLILPEGNVAVLNTRPGSADVILLKDGNLLSVSTQPAGNPEEAIYRLLNAAEAYGINMRECHIAVRDEKGREGALSDALDKMKLDASLLLEDDGTIPTAAVLTLARPAHNG